MALSLASNLTRTLEADVLVIGSGAGGAAVAACLAIGGATVLVLEKGPRYTRDDLRHDEVALAVGSGFFVPPIDQEPHVLVEGGRAPRLSSLGWIACCVGGGTTHMGAALYRFSPIDFTMRSAFGAHAEVADWPYTYDDLEDYYVRAERALGVSGSSEPVPFAGPRSAPLPLPPLDTDAFGAVCRSACERRGLRPFATPYAINSRAYGGRPPCRQCFTCGGYGCPVGARGSAQETLIAVAEGTQRCRVESLAMVRSITVNALGRASGCIYVDERGIERRARAKIVCVCCSAVESARLLLLSASRQYPDGLSNASGLVGRHLQLHSSSGVIGRIPVPERPFRIERRSYFLGCSLMDYYVLPPEATPYPKGGLLRFDLRRPSPIATAQRLARRADGTFVWGAALKNLLEGYFAGTRQIETDIYHDFLPNAGTFVTLDAHVKDKWQLPVARINLSQDAHHADAGRWLSSRAAEILADVGVADVAVSAVANVARQLLHGTCRAGNHPATSVLNEFCQSHSVPNLFVVDGSFMPTSGAAPSTLTIVANAMRTADYILGSVRGGQLVMSSV